MPSVFLRKGEKLWIASYKDERGRWRQRRGSASHRQTEQLARDLEDEARRRRLVTPVQGAKGNQCIKKAIEGYRIHLSQRRKGDRQVKQAASRLLRVFDAAGIRRLSEINADAIQEAVLSLGSQNGGRP